MSLEPDGTWSCRTCHSLNRREANRCYACRMAKDSAGRQTPGRPAGSPGVPVMAESIARTSGRPPVGPRVPVTAARIARSSGKAAGATVALATSKIAAAAPKVAVLAPAHVVFAVQHEASALVSVCPFLGLRNDPSTRYEFPESANRCHSASRRSAGSVAFPAACRRLQRYQTTAADRLRAPDDVLSDDCARDLCEVPSSQRGRSEPVAETRGGSKPAVLMTRP